VQLASGLRELERVVEDLDPVARREAEHLITAELSTVSWLAGSPALLATLLMAVTPK
jgi:hypothetical protein